MRFSVITPSFNQPDWLRLCAQSIADQGAVVEHIVQDAGTPGIESEIERWRPRTPGYRLSLVVEQDEGMYDAINRGLRKASGEICSYLNCDEQYLPGALGAVREFFLKNPDVDILFADAVVVDENGEYICHRKAQVPFQEQLWFRMPVLTCATFFRRRVFDVAGVWFDETKRVCGDVIWLMRAQHAGLRMGLLRRFTSVFTDAGEALGLGSKADDEFLALQGEMPWRVKRLLPAYLMYHRVRSVLGGVYLQHPFEFALYLKETPESRVVRRVAHPTQVWRSRLGIDAAALDKAGK